MEKPYDRLRITITVPVGTREIPYIINALYLQKGKIERVEVSYDHQEWDNKLKEIICRRPGGHIGELCLCNKEPPVS